MPSNRLILLTAASLAAIALAPTAARAGTYCVNTTTCLGGTVKPDLQAAIDASEADGGNADLIRLGAKDTPYTGPFTYDAGGNGGKLTIQGAGAGATILAPSGSGHTLSLDHPDSVVKHLTIRTPASGQFAALWLNGGTADDVRIEQQGNDFGTPGVNLYGSGSRVTNSEIAMTAGTGAVTGNPSGATNLRIDATQLTGRSAAEATYGAALTIDGAILDTARTAVTIGGNGSSASVSNSAVRMGNTSPGDAALSVLGHATLVATHVTLLGKGAGTGVSAGTTVNGTTASATVRNSTISGFTRYAACSADGGGSGTLTLTYTAVTGTGPSIDPDCTVSAATGMQVGVAPQFVGGSPGSDLAAADLRLKAPSPLIDAADPNAIVPVDLAGLARPVDGDGIGGARADLGALEYRRQAPVPALTAPATATVGEAVSMSAAGTTDPDGDSLSYLWNFGDGTAATGQNPFHAYSEPGQRTITLTVTDAAGRTATKQAMVSVAAAATPAPQPTGEPAPTIAPTPAQGVGGAPQTEPEADRVAPRITGLRIARRGKLRRGASQIGRRGAALRFSLDEPARAELVLRRGGRTKRLRFDAPAGPVGIALGRRSGLTRGRYAFTLRLTDRAGNLASAVRGTLTLR